MSYLPYILSILTIIAILAALPPLWRLGKRITIKKNNSYSIGLNPHYDHSATHRVAHAIFNFFTQSRVLERKIGYAHAAVFWGFILLLPEIIGFACEFYHIDFSLNLPIPAQQIIATTQDIIAGLTLVGIAAMTLRRLISPQNTHPSADAWIIIGMIAVLMLTKFVANAATLASATQNTLSALYYAPIARILSRVLRSLEPANYHTLIGVAIFIHLLIISLFLPVITRGKHLHILLAIPAWIFGHERHEYNATLDKDVGYHLLPHDTPEALEERILKALADKPALDENDMPSSGAKTQRDLSAKTILHAHACSQCKRCTLNCPVARAGGDLNPMQTQINLRQIIQNQRTRTSPSDNESKHHKNMPQPTLAQQLGLAETLWLCTFCGNCEKHCPIYLSHLPKMLAIRIGYTENGRLPAALIRSLQNLKKTFNPWGYTISHALPKKQQLPNKNNPQSPDNNQQNYVHNIDILWFSGCNATYNPKHHAADEKYLAILRSAGLNIATMTHPICCGEPAKMAGDIATFHQLATTNIEAIQAIKAARIATGCPHCATTLNRYYRELGLHIPAMHAIIIIDELLAQKRIELTAKEENLLVHPPCQLSNIRDARPAIQHIVHAAKMQATITEVDCCGAGGACAFHPSNEDVARKRRSNLRLNLNNKANVKTVSCCPFCIDQLNSTELEVTHLIDTIALKTPATPRQSTSNTRLGVGEDHRGSDARCGKAVLG